jgi:16S rRNA (guanine966-N2)-methyltransferase
MNIIAGKHRGRKLRTLKGQATRPVLGKIREALFNVLGDVSGLRVLDLFAGSGAVGIEALSRGASSLVAVEQSRAAVRIIRENLGLAGEAAEVVQDDVFRALRRLEAEKRSFDLVFVDAPYEEGLSQHAVLEVFARGLVAEPGFVVVTVRHGEALPGDAEWAGGKLPESARMVFDRRYGDTRLAIFAREQAPVPPA